MSTRTGPTGDRCGPARRRSWAPVVLLEAATLASGIGNAVVLLTIPWLVLDRTGSSAAAGLVAAAGTVPILVAAPATGWLIDRYGRRRISVVSDLASTVSVAGFPILGLLVELDLALIITLTVLGATIDPAGQSARRAYLPDVARAADADLEKLNGIHEGCFAVGWTLGPFLGAALIAGVGPVASFWAPTVLFLVATACVVAIRAPETPRDAGADAADRGWVSLVTGLRTLREDTALLIVTVAVIALAGLYLPIESVLLPAHFESADRPGALGAVLAAMSGGVVVGSFGFGWIRARWSRRRIAQVALGGVALSLWPITLLPPLAVIVAAGAVLGLAWGPFSPLMNSLVQDRVPAHRQGRVYGVQFALFGAAPPVTFVLVGAAAEHLGVRTTGLVLAAATTAVVTAVLVSGRLAALDAPAGS